MNDLATKEQHEVITRDKVIEYLDAFNIAGNLNDNEKKQFIEIATAYNLNPFKREIYAVSYQTSVKQPDGSWKKERKLSIITGYETYLKRAERLGFLNGWSVETTGQGDNRIARITIHRKDWQHPFTHEVLFSEYKEDNKMWREKPMTMLKKVVMAQGFRLAFPDEMGGMPYTSEELPEHMTSEPEQKPQPQPETKATPEVLKNPKGEIELKQGDHTAMLEKLGKCKNEDHLKIYYTTRDKYTWTTNELKAQDDFINILREQWQTENKALEGTM